MLVVSWQISPLKFNDLLLLHLVVWIGGGGPIKDSLLVLLPLLFYTQTCALSTLSLAHRVIYLNRFFVSNKVEEEEEENLSSPNYDQLTPRDEEDGEILCGFFTSSSAHNWRFFYCQKKKKKKEKYSTYAPLQCQFSSRKKFTKLQAFANRQGKILNRVLYGT